MLFADVVDSTARASQLGDRRWHDLLDGVHGAVRAELSRFRGRELDIAGDGMFATFGGLLITGGEQEAEMPRYEFLCEKCEKPFKGTKVIFQLVGFMGQTAKKS